MQPWIILKGIATLSNEFLGGRFDYLSYTGNVLKIHFLANLELQKYVKMVGFKYRTHENNPRTLTVKFTLK